MAQQKRAKYRRGLLAELEESGVTQREFAEQLGVSLSTLTFWLRKERLEQKAAEIGGTQLVRVDPPKSVSSTSEVFAVKFGDICIEVPRDVTTEEWKRLREVWTA